MKTTLLKPAALLCGLGLFLIPAKSSASVPVPGVQQQIPPSEYAALVDFYSSTHGDDWDFHFGWLDPNAESWMGVTVSGFEYNPETGEILTVGHVTELLLVDHFMYGTIPESIGDLVYLQTMNLSMNDLTGSIPASIGNLVNLRGLNLGGVSHFHNHLTGTIPESIGNLVNLEGLSLRGNPLTGNLPAFLGNLVKLTYLDLSGTGLSGSIPESLGNLVNLPYLDLSGHQLTGSIPESLGNIVNLQTLLLDGNQLSGAIPASLGNLAKLQALALYGNQLSGSIPQSFRNLTSLQGFYVAGNQLSGNIPDMSVLPSLGWFSIENNCFDIAPGSQVRTVVDKIAAAGAQVSYAPQNPDCAPRVPGDLTGDGCVDRDDFSMVLAQIRARSNDRSYDLNGDGKVDIADARWLVVHFTNPDGSPCTP